MRLFAYACLAALISAVSLSCSVNVLETFADKNSDEAKYIEARKLVNAGEYEAALLKIAEMGDTYAAKREVKMLKASAYGGQCGFTFLSFVKDISNMGSTLLLPFLTGAFEGGTPERIDACRAAEDVVNSIGAVADRSSDENMFMVLVSFAKIGNILSLYADENQNGVPDTAADNGGAAFDPCLETPRATRPTGPVNGDWYNDDLRELGTGITNALSNIGAVAGTVDLGNDSLDAITNACASLAALNPAYDFCSITDPADFTTNQLKGIKSLLKESTVVGLGTNCTGDISACFCL